MVRPVETIRREIDSLNEATVALAAEFSRLYAGYLDSVGVALRRQVVMAVYHLCTQVYPEGFLALSVSQREKLQRDIRRLGQQGYDRMQTLMEPPTEAPEPDSGGHLIVGLPALAGGTETPINLFAPALGEPNQEPEQQSEEESDLQGDWISNPMAQEPASDPEPNECADDPALAEHQSEETPDRRSEDSDNLPPPALLKSMVLAALAEEMGETFGERLFSGDHLTPTRLAKQHIFLEQQIHNLLQRISKQANHALQAAEVIPNLPDAVLDAASETEVGPSRGRAVPNVLSVLIAMASDMDVDEPLDSDDLDPEHDPSSTEEVDDSEDDDDPREGLMTHLAAVNLRLADLEFGDVQASMWRSKLRAALGQLRKLGKQYQKAQREMAIAEAEQAWRAVWYDDSGRS